MLFDQISIIGVGLIGGSVGLAAKKRGIARRIVGIGRDAGNLARAVEAGAIDAWSTDLSEGVKSAELVVVCTPVDQIAGLAKKAARFCSPGTLFTDGGSTKADIAAQAGGQFAPGIEFVPAHPLAGSEKTGAENALPDLFVNRTTVVTPIVGTSTAAVERIVKFWEALGSIVIAMTPGEHDRALAATSHLPHAVAAAVARATPIELLPLTAGGFRDVTRIAAGDPRLWMAIFQANRESMLAALAAFTESLSDFRRMLEAGDGAGLVRWLTEAKQVRDAL